MVDDWVLEEGACGVTWAGTMTWLVWVSLLFGWAVWDGFWGWMFVFLDWSFAGMFTVPPGTIIAGLLSFFLSTEGKAFDELEAIYWTENLTWIMDLL